MVDHKQDSPSPAQSRWQEALEQLPQEMTPSHDLWPAIAQRLQPQVQREARHGNWMPWAMAATVLLSCGALTLSWRNLQDARSLVAHQQFAVAENTVVSQLAAMEQEYRLARSALLTQIGYLSADTDPNLVAYVQQNLADIDRATDNLKSAIREHPEDPSLPALLQSTYQQELAVLTEVARLNQNLFSEEKI